MKKENDLKYTFKITALGFLVISIILFAMAFFVEWLGNIIGALGVFAFGSYFFGSFVTMMIVKECEEGT